ncbi:cation diffusion facilitator family transporter [Mesorhizobium sp.]|uniref:cation diffusion facilitator family transporter n=1 Tax=Mesorhizobium sp. TaxID=1871066 RepID=UPI0025F054CC|nr:cation diffusion facilitator family transporter [Mesorhizobium sp.]
MLTRILDWFGFGSHGHDHGGHGGHDHGGQGHDHHGPHGHTHGVIDATIATTARGIWAIKWSFVILTITAALQLAVVLFSGSVALLADTIHNIADATTAIPLWIAFVLARRRPTRTFTYGLGRVEDLAGIVIVLIILASALVAGYEAIDRLFNPQPVRFLGWLAAAGIIGFLGNEAVAVFRIRVGRQINSAALIADGYHARTDGLTSLAVVAGAVGVWLGYPLADPIIGLLITIAIFGIVWQSARSVLTRMLDGVEPGLVDEVHHAADHVAGIDRVVDAKARWLGHKLHVDVEIAVNDGLLLAAANNIAASLKTELFAHIPALDVATVRFAASKAEGATITRLTPSWCRASWRAACSRSSTRPRASACGCASRATPRACKRTSPSNAPAAPSRACRCRRSAATITICKALSRQPSRMSSAPGCNWRPVRTARTCPSPWPSRKATSTSTRMDDTGAL